MPDNTTAGMLEDFAALLIPQRDTLHPRAYAAVDAIPETKRRFVAAHRSKAVIHTWLAWQEEPGCGLGASITKRYLRPELPSAVAFAAWPRRLLGA